MKLIATDNLKVEGVPRIVRAGETIALPAKKARALVESGLAAPAKDAPELAVRAARERAVPFRNLKPRG